MWYNVDLQRFAAQMLPPLLRGGVLGAILSVLLLPVVWLYKRLRELRSSERLRLQGTGQVIAMRDALVRRFGLLEGDIEIIDAEDRQIYLYYEREEQQTPTYLKTLQPTRISYAREGRHVPDYTVLVPDYLRLRERDILDLLDHYKPAGRTYQLKYYAYYD